MPWHGKARTSDGMVRKILNKRDLKDRLCKDLWQEAFEADKTENTKALRED